MKYQVFNDLHFYDIESEDELARAKAIKKHAKEEHADVILVVGDILEGGSPLNHFSFLKSLFGDVKKIVFCLGNHEFAYKNPHEVYSKLLKQQTERMVKVAKEHIWCLDVVHYVDISPTIRIVGNTLWYDGSMKDYQDQNLLDFAGHRWLDRTIKDFNPVAECNKCKHDILASVKSAPGDVIMLTHCVPHKILNAHPTPSEFTAFSGVSDFLKKMPVGKVKWAVCGHTHKPSIGHTIHGINCVNVGYDTNVGDPIQSFTFEL